MITLSLDTATPAPSLALLDDDAVLAERTLPAQEGAGRRVAEEIHVLLSDAGQVVGGLQRVVVGVGPGGFTGLRIGMATALGLGQALAIPVVGVCSLETLACGIAHAAPGEIVVPVVDARRREVFTAAYRIGPGAIETLITPRAIGADEFARILDQLGTNAVVAGDGVGRVAEVVAGRARVLGDGPGHAIRAALALEVVARGGERPVAPLYLRLPDAEVNRRLREAARE